MSTVGRGNVSIDFKYDGLYCDDKLGGVDNLVLEFC